MFKIEPVVQLELLKHEDDNDVISAVRNDIEQVKNVFDDINAAARRNYDFYYGRQWSEEEIEAHERQKRIPYVLNEIKHKVDHLVGVQMQTRLDVKAVGREPGDQQAAELLTHLIKWVSQVNDLDYIETEVFKDGIIGNVGWACVYWSNEDVMYGYPKIEVVPYNEVYYDLNAKKRDLSDARWMARRSYITKAEAKEKYSWIEKEIDDLHPVAETYPAYANYPTYHQERVYGKTNPYNSHDREIVEEIIHYERVKVYKYYVIDDIRGDIQKFNTRKEAEDYLDGLVEAYSEEGISIINDDGTHKVFIGTAEQDQIKQTVVVGDLLVINEITILPDFPFVAYFPNFSHGEFQSFVEALIYPQILINRSFSQWDYILGASHKNVVTVMESLLRRGWDVEAVRREISKTVPVIPVMTHGAINSIPNNPVNPQIFQNIEFGIGRMQDYAGGRNSLGLTESAAESGRAVIARAEQGGVAKLPLFDALRFWRLKLTERIVWYIKNFMTPRQIIRIIGDDKDVQYVNLKNELLDTLEDAKVDIIIDEAIKSETMRERYFQQMLQLSNLMQLPPEITMSILLEYSSIPETKKNEIRQQLTFYTKYMEMKAKDAEEQKLALQVERELKKQTMKDAKRLGEQLAAASEDIKRQAKEVQTKMKNLQKMQQKAQEEQMKDALLMQLSQQNGSQDQQNFNLQM